MLENNENNHDRGMHVVIVDSRNGDIVHAKIFDTYVSSKLFEEFIQALDIPKGYFVLAACKDECSTNLSDTVKSWFAEMGSNNIWNIAYRCSFAFIGFYGMK